MKALQKFLQYMNGLIGAALALLTGLISIVVVAQVISRILHMSIPWSEECARYMMIYITYLGTAYAIRYKQLMSVTVVADLMPKRMKLFFAVFVQCVMLIFFLTMATEGLSMLKVVKNQLSASMHISMAIPYFAVVISGYLCAINCIGDIAEQLFLKENA